MPRRNYTEDDDEETTFTEDYRSTQKEKHMTAANVRLAAHNKTRVAYFHDEGVGNYHYGVSSSNIVLKREYWLNGVHFLYRSDIP